MPKMVNCLVLRASRIEAFKMSGNDEAVARPTLTLRLGNGNFAAPMIEYSSEKILETGVELLYQHVLKS
jgi:hypothetical protein